MKVVTVQQMQELEKTAGKGYGIKQIQLMENAGRAIAGWINEHRGELKGKKEVVIMCGSGNNGGDGFVSARYLREMGFKVVVVFLKKESDLKGAARSNFAKIKKNRKIQIHKAGSDKQFAKLNDIFSPAGLIVDCILGTGVKGEVKGYFRTVIEYINNLSQDAIAVDIPSGLDANAGTGLCVKAGVTLTMGLPKAGLLKPEIADVVGRLKVIDIGLPKDASKDIKSNLEYIKAQDFKGVISSRPFSSHKGSYGHVLILAGSPMYTGAAYLCAMGALRSGAGLVTLGVPRSLQNIYQVKLSEAMTLGLPETEYGTLSPDGYQEIMRFMERVDSIALGPGLTQNADTARLIKNIVTSSHKPIVIDADGVNIVAGEMLVLRKAKVPLIMTPHPGEMARLLHTSVKSVQNDRWKITRALADKYGVTLVLKGAHSIIAGKDKKIYINSTGNPGMASGGMGDVLTGMIAGLLGQGLGLLNSAKLGVFVHGKAGDMAVEERGEYGVLAADLLEKIPYAIKSISTSQGVYI